MFFATKRATILVPSGTAARPDLKHLFVILSDPFGKPPKCLLVSISSIKDGAYHDPTCLLYEGDHPFIQRPSFVRYQQCWVEDVAKLEAGVRAGYFVRREMMDGEIVARILAGCINSRHTTLEVKNLIVEQGWVIVDDAS